ncbi:MAG: DegQ family serine endoprotease [Gammaproteobacteria bacterium]|nr:DegQ family serine endoprotease [Gammaproteobacteria bacterium]
MLTSRAYAKSPLLWLFAGFVLLVGEAWAAELPDFTELVEDNAPAVVNISTVQRPDARSSRPRSRNDELDEFFRRFFGPDGGRGAPYSRPRSLGSGFVISRDGYLLTNNHVVEGADEILVRFSDRRELNAEIIGADPRSDLALLKVEADNLPTVELGRSDSLKVGEWVLAIGSPFGFDYSVTAGIVSAKGRSLPTEANENYVPFIQTDVAINPGNSGGPLFNLDGEVVGINSQIYSNSGGFMGVSFAIPIDVVMEVVDQLKESGRVSRGWLGVVIQEVNRDLAESFGLERPHGALVARVLDGSPAEEGGIREGDIITSFNGEPIDLSSELPHLVGRAPAGSDAVLGVVREGEKIRVTLAIGELADRGGDAVAGIQNEGGSSRLGLSVEPVPEAARERLGITGGVRVLNATGAAEEAGIRPGDIITRLNNREVDDPESLQAISEELPSGRSVPVLVIRGQVPTFLPLRVP